jgi:hypothetical protein
MPGGATVSGSLLDDDRYGEMIGKAVRVDIFGRVALGKAEGQRAVVFAVGDHFRVGFDPRGLFELMNEDISDEQIAEMIEQADADGGGELDYDEFKAIMLNL